MIVFVFKNEKEKEKEQGINGEKNWKVLDNYVRKTFGFGQNFSFQSASGKPIWHTFSLF